VGSKRQLAPLNAQFHAPVNSDFHPVVQLEAPRARFAQRSAHAIVDLANSALPANEMLGGLAMGTLSADHASGGTERILQLQAALDLHGVLARSRYPAQRLAPATALALKQPGALCRRQVSPALLEQLHAAALGTLSHLAPPARRELWTEPRWIGCPLARTERAVRERFAVYGAIATRDARAMHRHAGALLEGERPVDEAWGRFLLLTAVLGAKASDQGAEAQRLWSSHAPALIKGSLAPAERYIADWR
jgi:spermidine synthase